jgi:hypothetical protein
VIKFRSIKWPPFVALALPLLVLVSAVASEESGQFGPVFSPPGGAFTNQLLVQLLRTPATVRYTLDGAEPTTASPLFEKALSLTNSTLLRARSFDSDGNPGPITSQVYTALGEDVLDFSSTLPLVVMSSHGEKFPIEREAKLTGTIRFIAPKHGHAALMGEPDFEGVAQLYIRGHSSRRYPKHSFGVKLLDEKADKRKVSILGMPKQSDWVLYAPYPDKTLMRDVLAYELSNKMGHWAPRTRFVELFVNESGHKITMADYVGVYVFEDKITRDKDRVELAKLSPADETEPAITGGYIFKKDHFGRGELARARAEAPPSVGMLLPGGSSELPSGPGGFPANPTGFSTKSPGRAEARKLAKARKVEPQEKLPQVVTTTTYLGVRPRDIQDGRGSLGDDEVFGDEDGFWTPLAGNHFFYVEPEPDEITAVQRGWLKTHLNRFESALYGPAFLDASRGYAAYIEASSFIDYHIIAEATKNVDAFRFSTFYQKDRGGKIRMEPIWDMNLTFGNANTRDGFLPTGWLWPQLDDQQYSWFRRLFEDPDFGQKYVDRWAQLRTNVFATSNILARVNELAATLGEPQKRNFNRWRILGTTVTPNHFVGETYAQEVDWMKDWIQKRLAWMDDQFLAPPLGLKTGSDLLQLGSPLKSVRIFYTMDGTDPRLPAGNVNPKALLVNGEVKWAGKTRLIARVERDRRWSAPLVLDAP